MRRKGKRYNIYRMRFYLKSMHVLMETSVPGMGHTRNLAMSATSGASMCLLNSCCRGVRTITCKSTYVITKEKERWMKERDSVLHVCDREGKRKGEG